MSKYTVTLINDQGCAYYDNEFDTIAECKAWARDNTDNETNIKVNIESDKLSCDYYAKNGRLYKDYWRAV